MKRTALLRGPGPKRKTPIKPISKRGLSDKALDDLCRKLVRMRDGGVCQRCGSEARKLEWCHVINRQAKSIQWTPWNSLMLCGPKIYHWSCHHWFDGHKEAAMEWWRRAWPERALALDLWRHSRDHEVDRFATRLWLERQLEKASV